MNESSRVFRELSPTHLQNAMADSESLDMLYGEEKASDQMSKQPEENEENGPMATRQDLEGVSKSTPLDISVSANTTYERHQSAPLTLSRSLALDAVPQLDRSVSTASSFSSRRSSSSRHSESGLSSSKRRGYMRPQVTVYSESAKNRESVMSLGSIAHLQYYFARTGLLDGKGAQLAREDALKLKANGLNLRSVSTGSGDTQSNGTGMPTSPTEGPNPSTFSESDGQESPVLEGAETDWDADVMLPPTVSTYNQKPIHVAPPPDVSMLRSELTEAMEDALKVLKETACDADGSAGWYEIQGLHLLDIITLAIRAARNYYTAHTQPQRLYALRSERQIRNELYQVLEILKRMAGRNFAGGIRQNEKVEILAWIVGISELMQMEMDQEKREQEERQIFRWRIGDWVGREREREELFLRSFMDDSDEMPAWTEPSDDSPLPMAHLQFFQDGMRLCRLHNQMVRKSKRQFMEIKTWHTDTGKPYRMAENLRFWIKAAQLRWDVTIQLDVMAVVRGEDPVAWKAFDQALLKWCTAVREEIMAEWDDGVKSPVRMSAPISPAQTAAPTPDGVENAALNVPPIEEDPAIPVA